MEDPKEAAAPGESAPGEKIRKQPYEKPAIAWEDSLDIRPNLMAACGKVAGLSSACDAAVSS